MCSPELSDFETAIWQSFPQDSVLVLGTTSVNQNQINQFVRTRTYERLKFHVLKNIHIPVLGSPRPADQTALDFALKEGVSVSFDEIEIFAEPESQSKTSIQPRQIHKRGTLD